MRKGFVLAAFAFALLAASSASAQCTLTTETESVGPFFVNVNTNIQIVAVSGTPPYKFESIGDPLPDNLHLTPSGRILGKPEAETVSTVLIRITDAADCVLNIAYNIEVFPEP